eukprot:11261423-Karenia_brevis.AAC.1
MSDIQPRSHLGSSSRQRLRVVRCATVFAAMPFAPLGDEEREDALKAGRADLKWVLADNEVSEDVQAALFAGGFCKL